MRWSWPTRIRKSRLVGSLAPPAAPPAATRPSAQLNIATSTTRPAAAVGETPLGTPPAPPLEPLFLGDWVSALFIHYEVDAEALQSEVPFELDLWSGKAFVSLVAFSMRRLRPRWGGRLGELLLKPISDTRYLNVRTYVRHRNESGIYFIAKFVSNPLCVPIGSLTFGLPYRSGRLTFRHDHDRGVIEGELRAADGRGKLSYKATPRSPGEFHASQSGTLAAFLLERHTAFTQQRNQRRSFRVWHLPWLQRPMEIVVQDQGLLATTGKWVKHARLTGANFSPGVHDIWIGRPQRIYPRPVRRRLTVFFDD